MKRLLLLSGALLVLGASAAAAAPGLNLAWGAGCWADNPVNTKTFACNTNTGNAQITASYTPTADQTFFVGIEAVLDFQFDGALTVPDWWSFFEAGTCRQTSLSTSADFTAAPGGCTDAWFGLGAGGIAAYQTATSVPHDSSVTTPGRSRLKVAYALADASPLTGGTEYYAFRATINYLKTVGVCTGCSTPATIVLNQIKSAEGAPANTSEIIINEGINRCITWGSSTVPCIAVPTRNTSWGQIKSLYR
ncbi:MAG: hypothetical protein HZC42_00150 [Candidatus Eisenbacteria bacterium]|nr:hypothetical protein [Candidatus Eisenbacteria bacterium]